MASVAYSYACDKSGGFLMGPSPSQRVGYVTSLEGFGLPSRLTSDVLVTLPYNSGRTPAAFNGLHYISGPQIITARVIGVIEQIVWPGGVGDPITMDFWVSPTNAMRIKASQTGAQTTLTVSAFAWWIGGYDQAVKQWYQASYPVDGPVSGTVQNRPAPMMAVDLTPVVAGAGSNVLINKVSIAVAPTASRGYSLLFANSAQANVVKAWGGPALGSLASRPPP